MNRRKNRSRFGHTFGVEESLYIEQARMTLESIRPLMCKVIIDMVVPHYTWSRADRTLLLSRGTYISLQLDVELIVLGSMLLTMTVKGCGAINLVLIFMPSATTNGRNGNWKTQEELNEQHSKRTLKT